MLALIYFAFDWSLKKKIFNLNQTTLNATKCLDEERANVCVFVRAAPIKITQTSSGIIMPTGNNLKYRIITII